MNSVYVLGHKRNKNTKFKNPIINAFVNIITTFTKNKFFHTSLFIYRDDNVDIHLNYDIQNNNTLTYYHNLIHYKRGKPETIVCERIPVDVTRDQVIKIIKWWRAQKPYSKRKALIFVLRSFYMPFFRWYFRLTGKPYKSWIDVPLQNYCTTLSDKCPKECLNYDIIPELNEDIPYPGMLVNALKKRREELKNDV